ncbi:MAG: polyphosphate kinase 1 [Faecalibacterium prausnitzii]|nr:polyphosphate kinase 1 [Faecalibacterium prausnitzii]
MQSAAFRSEKRKRNMENTYHCYANRELSWLRFNERVLEEAEDSRLPLCERLSFLSIFQSNLDEFFMVRIGSLQDQMLLDKNARENKTNMTSGEQIDAALAFIHKLTARRDAAYNGLLEQLAEQGIRLLDFAHMEEESRAELEKLFRQDYLPLLSSFIISKKQAFPFLKNKGIYAVAVLSTKAEKKKIGIVPCGSEIFPRLVPVPGRTGCFILSEELILHFLPLLYKGYKVSSKTLARITRNADIDADLIYDEDLNYRDHMAEVVKKRKKLAPVRLELSREIDEEIIQSLCKNLKLDPKRVFEYDSPLDHSFLFQIEDQLRSHTDLFFAPRHPQPSPALDERKPIIPQIMQEDKLLHYPYESIRPFLQLLHEAACDPDVVSIKMTLYRLANHSKVVDALVEAAENGKQVDVLVELKARFDEENNIEWSRLLERAGCHVVYGIEGLKVHSKLCLITRKTKDGISFITQIGTGNYNEKTSRLYTDLSFLTASREIGLEATEIFRALDQGETVDSVKNLLVAPHCLQNRLLNLIDGEIEAAAREEGGYIGIKINSLTDKVLINKLIEASQAGVHIDMMVRGICCLRAGVPDETDNIHIISIVGRYLEHSRIYIFGRGERARYYIGSADWMTRSTLRRVEIAAPVTAPTLKARLQHIFNTMLADNSNARVQQPDGNYVRRMPGADAVDCQAQFYEEAYQANVHSDLK